MKIVKKIICVILVMLLFAMSGCGRVSVPQNASSKIVYQYNGVSFEEDLTPEEAALVAEILNGKAKTRFIMSTPSCGFDENIAIVINGTPYALARDRCATLQVCGAVATYIALSQSERDALEALFTTRGGTFPCA